MSIVLCHILFGFADGGELVVGDVFVDLAADGVPGYELGLGQWVFEGVVVGLLFDEFLEFFGHKLFLCDDIRYF